MVIILILLLLGQAMGQLTTELAAKNPKRGLVFLFNASYPLDYSQFTGPGNKNINKIKSEGGTVRYVLGFNEPDIPRKWGGSDISPTEAATLWQQYIQPLYSQGIKLRTPGVSSSPDGFTWMSSFFKACSGCIFDLLCIHHYGRPASSLKAHIERYHKLYPPLPIWLTEFADSKDTLNNTKQYISQALSQLDTTPYLERYSYFGASSELVSSIGPYAALLDNDGQLKPIGNSYFFAGNPQA
ncbi:hypothetical protein TWF718_002101 [Orbilia javanica]|uniref:Asl1-like glycosyl hydrolase catalytic domain-containing protein n=1 Tax=Orbilia javanica TaxID=47235 RepID=A0AAN8MMU1_9PEZI